MLKKICGLFLGLVVFAGSACVTPTHASSAENIIITTVQAAGPAGARDEYILIYNNSSLDVNVTGWCLVNKAGVHFACLMPQPDQPLRSVLPAYSYASFASEEFMSSRMFDSSFVSKVYSVTNQSSGSLVASADTLTLVDAEDTVVDTKSWSTATPTNKVLMRMKIMAGPDIYTSIDSDADWQITDPSDSIENQLEYREVIVDDPDGTPGNPDNPDDPDTPGDTPGEGENEEVLFEPMITELLPNPSGIDSGKEFIELFNPNEAAALSLDGLRIKVGASSPKWHDIPAGISIEPLSYRALYFEDLPFTLVNTSGQVQLYRGEVFVSDIVAYNNAPEAQSWAYINGTWQYTRQTSAGLPNTVDAQDLADEEATDSDINKPAATEKPCAANQFRNPETGRCKLIASSESKDPTSCKEGQERNPETNRCRNIATSGSALSPCKEGQERSPETNRCRNIVQMTKAEYGVKGVQSRNDSSVSWYLWLAIGGIVALIIGYGVWEWRAELMSSYQKLRARFEKKPL